MKSWIVVPFLIIFGVLGLVNFISIPQANDLTLDTNSTINAGKGEICFTPYTPRLECNEGLECVLFGEEPETTGVCLEKGRKITQEDIQRYGLDQFTKGK